MKITNKLDLPQPIVDAIRANWYGGGGEHRFASVTELIKPVKQFLLGKRHADELEQDAADMIWTLMGSAIHKVVEAADIDNAIQEERLSVSFKGARITGGFDLYHEGIVSDVKFTSVWSYIYGSRIKDWTIQLNLYAWLLERYGFNVDGIEVLAIFRDWSRHKAQADPSYPKPVERIRLELWDEEQVETWLEERIAEIKACDELPDDLIPECSPSERWEEPDRFAVMKPGAQRALRVFDSIDEARQFVNGHKEADRFAVMKPGAQRALRVFDSIDEARQFVSAHKEADNLRIVTRSEPPKRCAEFCPVNRFCHYYRAMGMNAEQNAA